MTREEVARTFPIGAKIRIKSAIPDNRAAGHFARDLLGKEGAVILCPEEGHVVEKFGLAVYVNIPSFPTADSIWVYPEWIEVVPDTTDDYNEIFRRKRDANLASVFS